LDSAEPSQLTPFKTSSSFQLTDPPIIVTHSDRRTITKDTVKNGRFFKRGIVQFLPAYDNYINEFKEESYNSWRFTSLQSRNLQPDQQIVKTDLILFTPKSGAKLLPIDCREIKIVESPTSIDSVRTVCCLCVVRCLYGLCCGRC
jgi:hypothetical protein